MERQPGMTIQKFVELLEQKPTSSPLLKALQALRMCDLDQLRDKPLPEWVVWENSGLAQT